MLDRTMAAAISPDVDHGSFDLHVDDISISFARRGGRLTWQWSLRRVTPSFGWQPRCNEQRAFPYLMRRLDEELDVYLMSTDDNGWTMLQMAAMWDSGAVAEKIIASLSYHNRNQVIMNQSGDDYASALHRTRSSKMADTLLMNVTPQLRQQFITLQDKCGRSAVYISLRWGRMGVFHTIWRYCNNTTRRQLLL